MIALMRCYKAWLYHKGAVISLAEGFSKVRQLRVQQVSEVMQAHDLFVMRQRPAYW